MEVRNNDADIYQRLYLYLQARPLIRWQVNKDMKV